MVELISRCTTVRSVLNRVDKLPPKLDVLYEQTFERINLQGKEQADLAKRVLTWVAFAFYPLTTRDLQYAVASCPDTDWSDPNNLVPESLLVSSCCGLLTVEERKVTRWRSHEHRAVQDDECIVRLVRQCHSSSV